MNQSETHTFHYLSVEECIRRNGYRHEFKGYYWLELGYDDRARGSFRKANREFAKADALKFTEDGIFDYLFKPIIDLLAKRISENILNGT